MRGCRGIPSATLAARGALAMCCFEPGDAVLVSTHALVAARPRTGRTHQVGVHLTHAGHPIVGDGVYRHRGALRVPLPSEAPVPRRQCLHASRLELRHPVTGDSLAFESPLAADMAALLEWMRAHLAP